MVKEGYTRETISAARHNDHIEQDTKEKYASKKTMITAALIPVAVSVPLIYKRMTESYTTTTVPVTAPIITPLQPVPSPFNPESIAMLQSPVVAQPTGIVADTSMEMLANVLDPLINLMVAVAFPIASVIMLGGCFFFMFGNSEKAWDVIGKAAMGYVIIRLSPMFLDILRSVGDAVA